MFDLVQTVVTSHIVTEGLESRQTAKAAAEVRATKTRREIELPCAA
jgi:hypothetical protein